MSTVNTLSRTNPHEAMNLVSQTVRQALGNVGVSNKKPTQQQRKRAAAINIRMTDASLHELAHQSAARGGVIAGFPFDPVEVTELLTVVATGQTVAREMRALSDELDDDLSLRRAALCRKAQAVLEALAAEAKFQDDEAVAAKRVRALKPRRSRAKRPVVVATKPSV